MHKGKVLKYGFCSFEYYKVTAVNLFLMYSHSFHLKALFCLAKDADFIKVNLPTSPFITIAPPFAFDLVSQPNNRRTTLELVVATKRAWTGGSENRLSLNMAT